MTDCTVSPASHVSHVSRPSRAARVGLLGYLSLLRQRRALAALDAAALRDIGVTPSAAQAEAARPVWDAPDHWT